MHPSPRTIAAEIVTSKATWGAKRFLATIGTPVNWSPWLPALIVGKRVLPWELWLPAIFAFAVLWFPMAFLFTRANVAVGVPLQLDDKGLRIGDRSWGRDQLSWIDIVGDRVRVSGGGKMEFVELWTDENGQQLAAAKLVVEEAQAFLKAKAKS